jgi:hypothetical protein
MHHGERKSYSLWQPIVMTMMMLLSGLHFTWVRIFNLLRFLHMSFLQRP